MPTPPFQHRFQCRGSEGVRLSTVRQGHHFMDSQNEPFVLGGKCRQRVSFHVLIDGYLCLNKQKNVRHTRRGRYKPFTLGEVAIRVESLVQNIPPEILRAGGILSSGGSFAAQDILLLGLKQVRKATVEVYLGYRPLAHQKTGADRALQASSRVAPPRVQSSPTISAPERVCLATPTAGAGCGDIPTLSARDTYIPGSSSARPAGQPGSYPRGALSQSLSPSSRSLSTRHSDHGSTSWPLPIPRGHPTDYAESLFINADTQEIAGPSDSDVSQALSCPFSSHYPYAPLPDFYRPPIEPLDAFNYSSLLSFEESVQGEDVGNASLQYSDSIPSPPNDFRFPVEPFGAPFYRTSFLPFHDHSASSAFYPFSKYA